MNAQVSGVQSTRGAADPRFLPEAETHRDGGICTSWFR